MPPRQERPAAITTLTELRRRVPSILERINDDPALAAAAATNPILALDELGERMTPALTADVERRVRFSRVDAKRLEALGREIDRAAGRSCRLEDPEQLARLLFVELGLQPPGSRARAAESQARAPGSPARGQTRSQAKSSRAQATDASAISPQLLRLVEPLPLRTSAERKPAPDPLARMSARHPVIKPLLAYRELEASQPRLASPELYAAVRSGAHPLPVANLRARLRRPASDA